MLKNTEKMKGLKLFQKYKVPILPYKVLDKNNFEKQITAFLKKYNLSKFMIRTSGNIPKFHQPPSINNASIDKDLDEIKKYFDEDFLVFVMHPGNIYKNFHSLNIMKDSKEEVIVEAVGPGFIASDLNRLGHAHEEIIFNGDMKLFSNNIIVSVESYSSEIKKKIDEIGFEKVRENKGYLLKHDKYVKLNDDEIDFIRSIYPRLEKIAIEMGFENFIASMSFVDIGNGDNEPYFWDMYGLS